MRARSLLIALAVAAGFVACGGDDNPSPPTVPTLFGPPTRIEIGGTTALTSVGQQSQLTANATFANGQTRNVSREAQWQVSNPAVASISETGLLRALALGETQVTASFRDVTSAPATVAIKTPASVTRLTIAGPGRVAPGATEQFTATADYSDGTSRDVSSSASWFVFPTTILQHTGGGRFRGVAVGEANVSAFLSPRGSSSLQILVLQPDTFRLAGRIRDASGTLENVLVEVLSGTGVGLKVKTGAGGWYALFGVAGSVQLRASAAGYDTQEATVAVSDNAERDFTLTPSSQPSTVSGDWTLALKTSSACSATWPEVAREREIPTTITQQGTRLTFKFGGSAVQNQFSFSSLSSGRIAGQAFQMILYFDDYYRLYGILDRPTPTDWVGIHGTAEGVATGSTSISGSFDGMFDYYSTAASATFPIGSPRPCAADPFFELRR